MKKIILIIVAAILLLTAGCSYDSSAYDCTGVEKEFLRDWMKECTSSYFIRICTDTVERLYCKRVDSSAGDKNDSGDVSSSCCTKYEELVPWKLFSKCKEFSRGDTRHAICLAEAMDACMDGVQTALLHPETHARLVNLCAAGRDTAVEKYVMNQSE